MTVSKYLLIGMVIILLISAIGCGKESPPSEGMTPSEVIARANTAMSELQSYRMQLRLSYTSDGGEAGETTIAAESVAPDRYYMKTDEDDSRTESITIGSKNYIRHDNLPWRLAEIPYQDDDPFAGSKIMVPSPDSLTNIERLPDEEINGRDCWHFRALSTMDTWIEGQTTAIESMEAPDWYREQRLEALDGMRRWTNTVELWIDKEDYFMRQNKSESRTAHPDPESGEEEWVTSRVLIQYYDFNAPIEIEPPLDVVLTRDYSAGTPGPLGPPSIDPPSNPSLAKVSLLFTLLLVIIWGTYLGFKR